MYDNHVGDREYRHLMSRISGVLNGSIDYDLKKVRKEAQELYEEGILSGSQYDNIMSYIDYN